MKAPAAPEGGAPRRDRDRISALPDSDEEARSLLQERLARLGRIGCSTAASFLAAAALIGLSGLSGDWGPRYLAPSAVSAAVFAGVWLICRGGRRSHRTLRALDAGAVFTLCQICALLLWLTLTPDIRLYTMLLSIAYLLVARSLLVPSSPHRTLLIGIASYGPFLWFVNGVDSGPHAIWITLWAALGVTIATVGSSVIFGLRREVREARRVGQYTLLQRLGEGGMGVVYKARHVMLRRPTAVKLLPAEKAGEANVRRFEREVQLTALLSHPNTVAIFDFGRTPDGIFYYAMEYLDGLDLEQLVRYDGPQPPARVAHILTQVCGSLREAHEAGLVHRDIKPGNIILCQRGGQPDVAKVVDFGLVKELEPTDGISHTELLAGTPLYLAPEAITGGAVDAGRDIYALGAVGYFLLTGRDLFEGATLAEVCSHHLRTLPVPPSRRLGRPIPAQLEAWVLACLEKDPKNRPPSARAAGEALIRCDDVDEWPEEDAARWWSRHRRSAALPGDDTRERDMGRSTRTMPIELTDRMPGGSTRRLD